MGLMDRIKYMSGFGGSPSLAATDETAMVKEALGDSSSSGSFLIFGGGASASTATAAFQLYEKSTAVSIPVNELATTFSTLIPVLRLADGTIIRDHAVLNLLRRPSPHFDRSLFQQTLAVNYLVTGEAWVAAFGGITRPPRTLHPISPKDVESSTGSTNQPLNNGAYGGPIAWQVQDDPFRDIYTGIIENLLSVRYVDNSQFKELQQIRNFSTKDSSLHRGQSVLLSAVKQVLQDIEGDIHNLSLLEKGGALSLAFGIQSDQSAEDFKETARLIRAKYGGSSSERIGVFQGDVTVDEMGQSNKDMEYSMLQKMVKETLAQVYNIPLPLVSLDAATFSNYNSAKLALYDDAVDPLSARIYGGLGELLLPRFGLNPSEVTITYDREAVPALKARRNEELVLRRGVNIESTDELRAAVGLDEVEGGNEILVQTSLIPISKIGDDPFSNPFDDIPDPPEGDDDDPAAPVDPEEPVEPEEEV